MRWRSGWARGLRGQLGQRPVQQFLRSRAEDFDFDINNISVTEAGSSRRLQRRLLPPAQALMVLKGSPIENATTMEIEDSVFGAQIGTTSLSFINTVIQPTVDPVFDSTSDAKAALRNGGVDGSSWIAHRVLRGDDRHAERRPGGPIPECGRVPRVLFEEGVLWWSA